MYATLGIKGTLTVTSDVFASISTPYLFTPNPLMTVSTPTTYVATPLVVSAFS